MVVVEEVEDLVVEGVVEVHGRLLGSIESFIIYRYPVTSIIL